MKQSFFSKIPVYFCSFTQRRSLMKNLTRYNFDRGRFQKRMNEISFSSSLAFRRQRVFEVEAFDFHSTTLFHEEIHYM